MEIENRLLADAMLCLTSTSGRRVQLTSLRPGDRLIGDRNNYAAYVVQNSREHRKVEIHWGNPKKFKEVLNYNQARIEFARVEPLALFPWWRKVLVALGVYR